MRPDWAGRTAFLLALGVAVALTTIVLTAAVEDRPLTSGEVTAIATVFGATVGAVATYLGGQSKQPPPRDGDDHDDTEERMK
jgi:Mn2+/Fe2+ NRAMP family transporter